MKKRNVIIFIMCLLLTVSAAISLSSCGRVTAPDIFNIRGSLFSAGKRTAADHKKFKKAVQKQGYIDGIKCDDIIDNGGLPAAWLAIKVVWGKTAGCYYDFDYDWYYDYDFEYDKELEHLIRTDSQYTAYEIYELYWEAPELYSDQTGVLEFFTFEDDADAENCARLLIDNVQFGSEHVYNEITEEDYSRFSKTDSDNIAVAARIGNTVIYYFGYADSPAYAVLDSLGYN